jgi:hypothetical protein
LGEAVVVGGQFTPPTIGLTDVPIRIVGPGRLELLGPDVLHVHGLKEKPLVLLTAALYLLVVLAFFGTIVGLVCMRRGANENVLRADHEERTRDSNGDYTYVVFFVVSGVGLGGSAFVRKKKRETSLRAGEEVDLDIPLSSVTALTWEGDVAVFRIKRSKPSGGLYFVPNHRQELEPIVAALQARGVKVASVPSVRQQLLGR